MSATHQEYISIDSVDNMVFASIAEKMGHMFHLLDMLKNTFPTNTASIAIIRHAYFQTMDLLMNEIEKFPPTARELGLHICNVNTRVVAPNLKISTDDINYVNDDIRNRIRYGENVHYYEYNVPDRFDLFAPSSIVPDLERTGPIRNVSVCELPVAMNSEYAVEGIRRRLPIAHRVVESNDTYSDTDESNIDDELNEISEIIRDASQNELLLNDTFLYSDGDVDDSMGFGAENIWSQRVVSGFYHP